MEMTSDPSKYDSQTSLLYSVKSTECQDAGARSDLQPGFESIKDTFKFLCMSNNKQVIRSSLESQSLDSKIKEELLLKSLPLFY